MKWSRYNRVVEVPGTSDRVMFNGVTGALVRLDADGWEKVTTVRGLCESGNEIPQNDNLHEIHSNLLQGKFLVPREVDEFEFIRARFNVSRFTDGMVLTILPTLTCNLACNYCYEHGGSDTMSRDVADALVEFARKKIEGDRLGKFRVDWYGGEPLLALDTVVHLSKSFQAICDANRCKYQSGMTTNGTLLAPKVLDVLLKRGLTNCQVTLDGPREVHDARRPFKHGSSSSFDAIMNNLEYAVGKIRITVRINTDTRNPEAAISLLKLFNDRGWFNRDLTFIPYMARVSVLPAACRDVSEHCYPMGDFYDCSFRFMEECRRYGLKVKGNSFYHFPHVVKYGCAGLGLNSLVVNTRGSLFKCGFMVEDDTKRVGTIFEPLDLMNANLLQWITYDPFKRGRCRECEILPVCMSDCAKQAMDGVEVPDSCEPFKANFDRILLFHGT